MSQQATLDQLLVELQRVRESDPPSFLRGIAVEALHEQIERANRAMRALVPEQVRPRIPDSCGHGSHVFTTPLPGCAHCGGSGRVRYETDEYPSGTNACCCTCGECREAA